MWEVGDLVRLQTVNRDASGNPVAADPVSLAVTQPDGSLAAPPAVSGDGAGSYWADFPAAQAGRHLIRWTGAATQAFANADVLNVWPTDPRFLISLADARAAIGRGSRASVVDEDLRMFIAAVTPIIEDIVGPLLGSTVTRAYDGGSSAILLPLAFQSVSVVESGSPALDITTDPAAGIVFAGTAFAPRLFLPGRQNIVITYTVGGGPILSNYLLAAREELRFLWENAQGAHHADEDDEAEVAYTRSGYAVPATVLQLCASARPSFGGFA